MERFLFLILLIDIHLFHFFMSLIIKFFVIKSIISFSFLLQPIKLIFNQTHSFIIVEKAYLVSLWLFIQHPPFLSIFDRISCQDSLFMNNVKSQICCWRKYQHFHTFIKRLRKRSNWCTLSVNTKTNFDLSLFEFFNHSGMKLQVKNTNPQFPKLTTVESYLKFSIPNLFVFIIEQITFNRMRISSMFKEGVDIIATFTPFSLSLETTKNQSSGIFRNFHEKNLIERWSRRFRGCINLGYLPKSNVNMDGISYSFNFHLLNKNMQISNNFHFFAFVLIFFLNIVSL